ncbi:MAG: AMP-binding protein, partial [bacterium]|nr:AMP-binding protein [bacterium]
SGTTGKPKGMMIEHKNVVRLLFNSKFQFDFDDSDVWSLFHSFSFDFSVWEMYGALLYGGRLVIIPQMTARDPGVFLDILKEEKVTVLNQTPSAFYRLVEEELKLPGQELNVRIVVFGGEALKPGQLAQWRTRYPDATLVNMYGITETTVHVTYKEIGEQEIRSGISNIGKPIPTLNVYVMDPGLNLQPMGVPGQCCVGGEGVGRGYLNRVELTLEKFVDNPYKPGERLYLSGDLVRRLSNGEMEYLGRIDHQVKVRGYRVELGEIENQLLKQKGARLKDALVIMKEDKDGENYLCAYIVPVQGDIIPTEREIDTERLRNDLSQTLPAYMIPSYFVPLEQIPLTPNGKVDKTALPGPRTSSGGQYVSPRDQVEEKLVEIWQRVLELERVGINEDFFFLGGDSIKALRLVSSINDELNSDLKLIDLYTSGTIEKLSGRITTDKDVERVRLTERAIEEMERLKTRITPQMETPEDFEDIFPLSDIQNGLVFYYLKHTGSGLYHDQLVYPVRYANFKLERFKHALNLIVKKHGILRTGFNIEDFDEPVQIVRKEAVLNFDYQDISRSGDKEQEQLIGAFLEKDLATPFKVDDSPFWRFKLFSRGNGYFVVVFIFHHAILDGWSTASMMSELHNTYVRLKTAPRYVPPPLGCGYKDSVIAEMVDKENPQTIRYWKNELREYKRTDFTETLKDDRKSPGMKVYRTSVGGEMISRLRHLIGLHSTSLKNLCFSAYLFVMNMLTHESDLVVGMVTNNRPVHEDGDKVLGCFLNTIPVRMQIPTGITWAGYIEIMERKLQELRQHERLPLFEIARVIEERNKDRNPIFDTLFNFTDFHIYSDIDMEGFLQSESTTKKEPDVPAKQFDFFGSQMTNTLFDFEVDITGGIISVHPKYVPSAISDEVVQKSCIYFVEVLNKFIHEPETPLSKDAILSPEEKQKLLVEFNDTASQYSTEETMHGLFQEQVERTPGHIAVLGTAARGMAAVTYRKLNEKTNQLAHMLREKGVTPGDLVAVIMNRSIHMVMAVMGILKAGGVYVPLEPYLPDIRIQKILSSLGVNILLTDAEEYQRVEGMSKSVESLETILCPGDKDREEIAGYSIDNPDSIVSSVDFAYTIFTSGSTGTPKGVVEMHRPVVNVIQWVNRTFNVGQPDKLLFVASLGFDLSVYDIFGI